MTITPTTSAPRFVIKLVDGAALTEQSIPSTPVLRGLLARPERVNTLSCIAINPTELTGLIPLLERYMPLLENLDIEVQHPTDPEAVCLTVPFLAMPTPWFPSLKRLRLNGVAIRMAVPFLVSLRHLILENYPGVERRLRVQQFIAAMASCPSLETLVWKNYGGALITEGEQPRAPAMLRSLKNLAVSDTPRAVALLLQFLYIPATTNVHLVVDVKGHYQDDFGRAFEAALPLDRRTLPILQEVTAVEVTLTGNRYRLTGTTPQKSKLVIDIDMDIELGLGIMERDRLYESTLRNVGRIFADSPVTSAAFIGDFAKVTAGSWLAVLCALPDLTRIQLDDHGKHAPDTLPLFDVLGLTISVKTCTPRRIVSPKLEFLGLRGSSYGSSVVGGCVRCLARRKVAGMDPTKFKLWMELSADKVRGDEVELTRHKNALAQLGAQCCVQMK